MNARSCGDCESIPLYPNEGEATKFQIVQLQNAADGDLTSSNCDHFVAVSYCWPPPQYDTDENFVQHKGRFSVKDVMGESGQIELPKMSLLELPSLLLRMESGSS